MGSTSGQATIDYVALVAVLAIAFTLALGVAAEGAAGVVNAVTGQIRHALCIVAGGPCAGPRARPCTVASRRVLHHVAVNLFVVRLDHDRSLLREQMSDGSVRLTVTRTEAAGLAGGFGATARVSVKRHWLGGSGELRAGLQGTLGGGHVYVARDAREADGFVRALRDGRSPGPPREVFYSGGVRGLVQAGLGSAWLEGTSSTTIAARRDRPTGDVTVGVNAGGSAWGTLATALGGPAAGLDGAGVLTVTLDRRRRPTELGLSAAGTLDAGAALPLSLTRAIGSARLEGADATMAGRRWELGARLDLRDPVVAPLWARVRRDPTDRAAIAALAAVGRDRAYLDVRAYATDSAAAGIEAGVAGGVRIGGEYDRITDRARLLAASSRPPAGLWEKRLDCVAA